jgi:hypothetical protein
MILPIGRLERDWSPVIEEANGWPASRTKADRCAGIARIEIRPGAFSIAALSLNRHGIAFFVHVDSEERRHASVQ